MLQTVGQGAVSRDLIGRLRHGPLATESLSSDEARAARSFMVHGIAFTTGHRTPANPQHLWLTGRASRLLAGLDSLSGALADARRPPLSGDGGPPPAPVIALRCRASSVLREPRHLAVLFAAGRANQTIASVHLRVGGKFRDVANDLSILRDWMFITTTTTTDDPELPGDLTLRADRDALTHVCELLTFVSRVNLRDHGALPEHVPLALKGIVAQLQAGDDAAAMDAAEALLATPEGRSLLERWRDLHGFLREAPAQRLLAEPGEWTPGNAARVTGLSPRPVSAVLHHLARFDLRPAGGPVQPGSTSEATTAALVPLLDALAEPVAAAVAASTRPSELAATLANRNRRLILGCLGGTGTPLTVGQLAESTGMAMMSGHIMTLERAGLIETTMAGGVKLCRLPSNAAVVEPLALILAAEEHQLSVDGEPRYAVRALVPQAAQDLCRALAGAEVADGGCHERECLDAMDAQSAEDVAAGRVLISELEDTWVIQVLRPSASAETWRYRLSPAGRELLSSLTALAELSTGPLPDGQVIRRLCADLLVPERLLAALYVAQHSSRSASIADVAREMGVEPRPLYSFRMLCSVSPGTLRYPSTRNLSAHPLTAGPLLDVLDAVARDACPGDGDLSRVLDLVRIGPMTRSHVRFLSERFAGPLGQAWSDVFSALTVSGQRTIRFAELANAPRDAVIADPSLRPLAEGRLLRMRGDGSSLSALGDAVAAGLRNLLVPAAMTNSAVSTTAARLGGLLEALDDNLNQDILSGALDLPVAVETLVKTMSVPKRRAAYHIDILRDVALLGPRGRSHAGDRQAYRVPMRGRAALRWILEFVAPNGLHVGVPAAAPEKPAIE